jgi:NAD(P)-dependent dehydrogenase (short-subunit alcohol dehydrogenase family)
MVLEVSPGVDSIGCMSEQTIALVTGANKGIGYQIAAGLGALGWSVGVGRPRWRSCARRASTRSGCRWT